VTLTIKRQLDLSMTWNRGGQIQVKSYAAPIGTDRPQTATMRLNDGQADAKPHVILWNTFGEIKDIA
jgi:hypothetical protein